jgi:NitT/TauT family transport system ATP-binding protein
VASAAADRATGKPVAALNGLAIDVRSKRFPGVGDAPPVLALENIRLTVRAGEFVCLLGPSGCGKTTLLNIVAGLDTDFAGTISRPVDVRRNAPVIGYVFQKPRLLPWRTVKENVELVLSPAQRQSGIVDELLAITGLAEFHHTYPERLSVGMARRVALVRAFAVEPNLLLLDEPFVSLDESTAERLRALLVDIWTRRPTTVLFVSHDTREVLQLADRIVLLTSAPGRIKAVIPVDLSRAERSDPARLDALRRTLLDPHLTDS